MSKEKKPTLVIIDYTSLLYSACYNNQVVDEKTDNFKEYRDSIDFYTEAILKDTKADFYIAVGDGFSSFRKVKYPKTKADRKGKPAMKFLRDLKDYAYDKYSVITNELMEADDICLMLHDYYKTEYDVIIASKDSDLKQAPAMFYNYGWRRSLYKKGMPDPSEADLKKGLKDAFELVDTILADFNLWKSVLIKGHNNKSNYLAGCGEKTAEAYLSSEDDFGSEHSVLYAFIHGIAKNGTTIKRGVKGYGTVKGVSEFAKSFEQSYLLRTFDEMYDKFPETKEGANALWHQVKEVVLPKEDSDNIEDVEEDVFADNDDNIDDNNNDDL